MKKMSAVSIIVLLALIGSCSSPSDNSTKKTDSSASNPSGPDSAANNGIIPPSASPSNSGNSSLADTAYHAGDTSKRK